MPGKEVSRRPSCTSVRKSAVAQLRKHVARCWPRRLTDAPVGRLPDDEAADHHLYREQGGTMKSRHRVVVPALITSVFAAAPAQAQQRLDLSAVFLETAVDERPERISCPTLEYPRELQAADIQGSVLLRFVVDTMGRVEPSSVEVLSSTREGFERPATPLRRHS